MRHLTFVFTILFAAFLTVILYLINTGQDNPLFKLVRETPYGDKIGHFVLFGLLTLALNLCLKMRSISALGIRWPIGSLIVFLVVTIEEGSQHFMITRSFDLNDWFANVLGIIVFSLFPRKRKDRS